MSDDQTIAAATAETASIPSSPWCYLVVAMLSVNSYPLVKTLELIEALEANGLFDLPNYLSWERAEIARRLGAAGYDRGPGMTEIFVDRLASLAGLARDIDKNAAVLNSGSEAQLADALAGVKGIGPTVIANYILLRGDPKQAIPLGMQSAHSPS